MDSSRSWREVVDQVRSNSRRFLGTPRRIAHSARGVVGAGGLGGSGPGLSVTTPNKAIGDPSGHLASHILLAGLPLPTIYSPTGGDGSNFGFETQTITSATAMAPTSNNEYLAFMALYPGAKASWLETTIKSPYKLIFPAGFAGLSTAGAAGPGRPTIYRMNWLIPGTSGLAAASMTFGGGLQAVDFIYAKKGVPDGIDLNGLDFLGEAATTDETGTAGTTSTDTFTAGKSKPTQLIALSTVEATASGIARARVSMPKVGSYAIPSVPAEMPLYGYPRLWPIGFYDPSTTFAVVHKCDALGGATNVNIAHVTYYRPSP